MDGSFSNAFEDHLLALRPATERILTVQEDSGAIPWFEDGPWDPWNHVEAAMALTVMGEPAAAVAAFDYLARTQREDGAWFGEYGNTLPMVDRIYISREPAPAFLDSNFCAYPAVGIAHYLAATGDIARATDWWPMVQRALDLVIGLQRPDGTISWAVEAVGTDEDDALLAGNASIAKSLECGLYLAERLGQSRMDWRDAHARLLDALRHHPERFDRRGQGARFAMDWYYPVLAGAHSQTDDASRLDRDWDRFVIASLGCRCVSDEPWVTVAESAELVIALIAADRRDLAKDLFDDLQNIRDPNGVFWMGWQTEEAIVWPREQPSWTQAAVILAADALYGTSAASTVLTRSQTTGAAVS